MATATLGPGMGLVYSYLIAWVAGGVLLAAGLLLGRATSEPTKAATALEPAVPVPSPSEPGVASGEPLPALPPLPARRPRFSLLAMGLVAYGGVGLVAEALGMPDAALRPLSAAAAGLGIIAVSLVLLRRPTA